MSAAGWSWNWSAGASYSKVQEVVLGETGVSLQLMLLLSCAGTAARLIWNRSAGAGCLKIHELLLGEAVTSSVVDAGVCCLVELGDAGAGTVGLAAHVAGCCVIISWSLPWTWSEETKSDLGRLSEISP